MKLFYSFCLSLFCYCSVLAQCNRSNFYDGQYDADQGAGVYRTITNYSPGEYFRMPVIEGGSYTIQTCGSPIDTQITLYEGNSTTAGSHFAYNDDNGPICGGLQASIDFVPNFTDYVRADVRQYNCLPGGSSSITVRIRQNNNLSITSSIATMAPGETRALTATPTRSTATPFAGAGDRGTFSGTGVSGTTFTAPAVSVGNTETFTITYTFGFATTTQDIIVDGGLLEPGYDFETYIYTSGNANVDNLTALLTGESGASFKVYDADSGGTEIASGTDLTDNSIVYAVQEVGGNESVTRLPIPVKEICAASQILTAGSTVADLSSTPSGGSTVDWYFNASGGIALPSTSVLSSGNIWVQQNGAQTVQTLNSLNFNRPEDVAVESSGDILIANTNGGTINRLQVGGAQQFITNAITSPNAIAVEATGDILVSDPTNNAIIRIDSGNNVTTFISSIPGPVDIDIDNSGNIYVIDNASNVKRFDSSGNNETIVGSGFNNPTALAVDATGNVYVADRSNNAIKRIATDGVTVTTVQSNVFGLNGLAIDSSGDIFFSSDSPDEIKKMDTNGNITSIASSFNEPAGIAIDASGNVIVADKLNNDVKRINFIQSNRVQVLVELTAEFSVNDVSIAEGDSGTSTLDFTVTLSEPAPAGGATVDFATSDGTATAGSDYTAATGTLSFAAGESSKSISIDVLGDLTPEITESFTIILSNPTGTSVVISDAEGTGTIVNDDFVNGLQLTAADTSYLIDFDNTVAGINNGTFLGTGLAPSPLQGQLDSNGIRIEGLSDGLSDFGDMSSSGGFIGGTSAGSVTTGGLYAFDISNGGTLNTALGVQPDGDDLTPGAIIFKFQNRSGSAITSLDVGYELLVRNDASGASSIGFEHGSDFNSTSNVAALLYQAPEAAGIFSGEWRANYFQTSISVNIPDGGSYYFKWSIQDISGVGTWDEFAFDNIEVVANASNTALSVAGDYETMNIDGTLALSSPVNVFGQLNVSSGDLTTNSNLTLKSVNYPAGVTGLASDVLRTAIVNPVLNGGSINGNVTVEQFYPANRAFRFVTSPVQMSSDINSNWQEGGSSTSGLGIQITGGSVTDGFDQSNTNNPSAFYYDPTGSSLGTSGWVAFPNTNTAIGPDIASRVFVRGDRTVSLINPSGTGASETKLRTTGTLVTGDFSIDNSSPVAFGPDGSFYLMPNPYQAPVDLSQTLNSTNSEDIRTDNYYAWQPVTENYVTYDFATGGLQNGVTQFIQPGQAYFVQTDEASGTTAGYAPSVTYRESQKGSSVIATQTYSIPEAIYSIKMYDANLAGGAIANDLVRGFINTGYNNGVDNQDAMKIYGMREQLSVLTNGTELSIERRDHFADGEIMPLRIYQMEDGNYTFELEFNDLVDTTVELVDNHMGTATQIMQNQSFSYGFDIDLGDTGSFASDRFYIRFTTGTLSAGDVAFAKAVQLYPNPVSAGILNISGLQAGDVEVIFTNMLGQKVIETVETSRNGQVSIAGLDRFKAGIYLVSISQGEQSTSRKVVIK